LSGKDWNRVGTDTSQARAGKSGKDYRSPIIVDGLKVLFSDEILTENEEWDLI